jgi:hypothetical protein
MDLTTNSDINLEPKEEGEKLQTDSPGAEEEKNKGSMKRKFDPASQKIVAVGLAVGLGLSLVLLSLSSVVTALGKMDLELKIKRKENA